MTAKELENREHEIKTLIQHYRMQSMDLQTQIITNEREICKLNGQLTDLHYQLRNAYLQEEAL